ncbi:MAG: GlsB/YeaQ/YmgE family stress response membrane protein [Geodermatophilaceae bacterium]|nr:GlsB/YeaQ/YmgE family stress response membrane protein [Geodermatophilaceae bacterium]
MEVLGVIVAGIIIGLLGKLVAPGDKDNTPLWATILAGIAGVLIGWYVSAALGVAETAGVDWIRWIISIIVAAVLVVLVATLMGRNKRSLTR